MEVTVKPDNLTNRVTTIIFKRDTFEDEQILSVLGKLMLQRHEDPYPKRKSSLQTAKLPICTLG